MPGTSTGQSGIETEGNAGIYVSYSLTHVLVTIRSIPADAGS